MLEEIYASILAHLPDEDKIIQVEEEESVKAPTEIEEKEEEIHKEQS